MAMILNSPAPPAPPAPPPPVLDRAGLAQADKSLRAVRLFVRLVLVLVVAVALLAVEPSHGASLIAIPSGFVSWLLIEVGIIAARACVASAWAHRGEP